MKFPQCALMTPLLYRKMDQLEASLGGVQVSVAALHRTLPSLVRYEVKLATLESVISTVWAAYSRLELYQGGTTQLCH